MKNLFKYASLLLAAAVLLLPSCLEKEDNPDDPNGN